MEDLVVGLLATNTDIICKPLETKPWAWGATPYDSRGRRCSEIPDRAEPERSWQRGR
jgi:hypothetical protein